MGFFESGKLIRRKDYGHNDPLIKIQEAFFNADVCVASRVSNYSDGVESRVAKELACDLLYVKPALAPITIHYSHPEKLGQDRIANAIGAREIAPQGAIVVDFGTATHFDVVDSKGDFCGGPIMIGLESMIQALSQRIPHLPEIDLKTIERAVSQSTEEAIRCGAILGTAGSVEKIIQYIRRDLDLEPRIILTGGCAPVVMPHLKYDLWEPNLTLTGLCRYAESLS